MTDTTDIEALVEFLRGEAHRALGLRFNITGKGFSDAADALERQQGVVEAAREFLNVQFKMNENFPTRRGYRKDIDELLDALAALDAPPEGTKP